MENSHESINGNGSDNCHSMMRHSSSYHPTTKVSLSWLDLKVFYVRITKCGIDDTTPENLTLNHVPLYRDTLLEINSVRTSIYSDGVSSLLRRDRLDKKSEEVTFVSTDSIRVSRGVKFEVFDKDVLLLSGVLEFCTSNGGLGGESECHDQKWSMNCESELVAGNGFLKGKPYTSLVSGSPRIEVYVAGWFAGSPIVLTRTLQLSLRKKQMRNRNLDSIPEYDAAESQKDGPSTLQVSDYPNYKPENEAYTRLYAGTEYLEGEDGELSWFNAGVRVGVGIGLGVCLGLGIGVGLLVRTYQGTTRNFRRRLL
ncbi:hypothetical protein CEY00_Acc07044 [Actinidia chinensis var. chinensis]|uniref:Erythronate-4-phosphate dehydrogenase family protein n=1 Tax=Actinidia chinensis var. chinensis TaxID=1590841 RepID=A0A2R6RHF3_ACTCC|nr:hypothetical protein CEY00_Acc07044 [Actinidia chinensis var. chinensis]